MTELALGLFNFLAPTGAAAPIGGAVVQTAGSGLTLAKLLGGTLTVLGAVQAINAGNEKAEEYKLAADDAARQVPLETLKGVNRRSSIKQEMMDSVGEMDVANASSGVDLTFGTPTQARKEAFRQTDLATSTAVGEEQTQVARLNEKEANYRKLSKRAKSSGLFDGLLTGLGGIGKLADIG
ncbi:hypothetical protein J5N58_01210 [Rhizobium cremeum]|uniref:hypothetical protein n=1 Tax=Rhizobium cremeum TaxID=2813827 RepID=UPI001FD13097|nr:hypothetical protein [Rhizobium cremeum]MCJ7993215.1 hypothetical protein [Rhizobium cremeum]MCJ7998280.1 hypothetical protein [Rhizobium cremeum]